MSVPNGLELLAGRWRGTYLLVRPWVTPSEAESESQATVSFPAQGSFLALHYTWAVDSAAHDGLLLIGAHPESGALSASWVDSWHQSGEILLSKGGLSAGGSVEVTGSYPAPPDPDWRWRTRLEMHGDGFEMVMINIAPDGKEELAVRARYRRES
jgi:hypothetical protein